MYKHTQFGWVMLVCAVVVFLGGFVIPQKDAMIVSVAVALVILVFFLTLTVVVTQTDIVLRFGIGLCRKKIKLSEIATCKPLRIKWWWGWGIHGCPGRGWLFNVSGLQSVSVTMKNGMVYLIGTDEPEKLSKTIQERVGG